MTSSIRAPEGEATLMARGEASRRLPTIEATREGPSVAGTQDTRRRRRDNIGSVHDTSLSSGYSKPPKEENIYEEAGYGGNKRRGGNFNYNEDPTAYPENYN
jgi:hypothetical protein